MINSTHHLPASRAWIANTKWARVRWLCHPESSKEDTHNPLREVAIVSNPNANRLADTLEAKEKVKNKAQFQ